MNGNFIKDERLTKQVNQVNTQSFIIMEILCIISIIIKGIIFKELLLCFIELLILIGGNLYIGIEIVINKINPVVFIKEKNDEMIIDYKRKIISRCFIGGFILTLIAPAPYLFLYNNLYAAMSYMIIMFISAGYATFKYVKDGLFIPLRRKDKKDWKKSFKRNVVIGSLFFGFSTNLNKIFLNGVFHPKGLIGVLISAGLWGCMFYTSMLFMIKFSTKLADKKIDDK
ncbi:DUF6773 family protein [Clostridium septicum]|uniref:DUF3278 domain-containing protein n=1 Tax=Clostridium septicum TaxID=1504 RepID=A0A9N7JN88_CLOSE|nr:DUF6773 family protein [Clostridium septicum]AYE34926.1 hypothetical protein CP523_11165 [Clostridium septicum]MDU1313855.1 DUF6773 family protein [Clostridium septicum]QAS60320.1 hypothetical protein EI377_05955 [Clostridium septicum]UEC20425.1 hypothetical protein LK444_13665 [Clostridium septicum]USS01518.1 hypothetical protein NH397_03510 [Clostridium septicum]